MAQAEDFTLGNKSAAHYLALLLTCASPVVCLVAFILCLRTPMRRRKVWWALFTLIGVVTFQFNWTTGEVGFQPFSIQFLGASAICAPDM